MRACVYDLLPSVIGQLDWVGTNSFRGHSKRVIAAVLLDHRALCWFHGALADANADDPGAAGSANQVPGG